MDRLQVIGLAAALLTLFATVELLRRRQLREKYAALWLLVAIGIVGLAIWPRALDAIADRVGVADPPNLLAFVALFFLLGVCAHLSWEASRLEDETRDLAEEVALLRHEVDQLRDGALGRDGAA